MSNTRPSVAVIGGGIAGLASAFLLRQRCRVTLYERGNHIGGHAHTVTLQSGPDAGLPLDLGFMVFNACNYPLMHDLLRDLGGVQVAETDMSFGFYSKARGLQLGFSNPGKRAAFEQAVAAPRPEDRLQLTLLKEAIQFGQAAARDLETEDLNGLTLADYLRRKQTTAALTEFYIVPSAAAIWSTTLQSVLEFPAATYLRFMHNHGMLTRRNVPTWEYVRGGSQTYVRRLLEHLEGPAHRGVEVSQVVRNRDRVVVVVDGREQPHDHVVIATHADEALRLLADPTDEEKRLLGAWSYQTNHAVLHSDASVLPPDRGAWAAWNYSEIPSAGGATPGCITYFLNRLQGHAQTRKPYFLSLCERDDLIVDDVVLRTSFRHPQYTFASVASQAQLPTLNGKHRTSYCGSYFGYGFHEDAIASAHGVARAFGIEA